MLRYFSTLLTAVLLVVAGLPKTISSGMCGETSAADVSVAQGTFQEWTYNWTPSNDERPPQATICPLMFDKKWAYAVEIDDGPASTACVAQPLLAEFKFTDAPPGMRGGKSRPFVGSAAVIVERTGTANQTFLNWQQLRKLREQGWDVLNHSYAHSGNGWDPKAAMTADQIRQDLFWSQAILAAALAEPATLVSLPQTIPGRPPTHFVYPNGYLAFEPLLHDFGLRSASRVAGRRCNVLDPQAEWLDIDRNYLDEGPWAEAADPLWGLPAQPKFGDLVVDFTHGIQADPQSANHRRWRARLGSIATRFAAGGSDEVWCATTPTIVGYVLAARVSNVKTHVGRFTLSRPDWCATPLTIKLSGLKAPSKLEAPVGGSLFRQGDTAWLTTGPSSFADAKPTHTVGPPVCRASEGKLDAAKNVAGARHQIQLASGTRVAAVRVLQHGEPRADFELKIELAEPDGVKQALASTPLKANWGAWLLFPIVPTREAPLATQIELTTDPCLQAVEVWAVADESTAAKLPQRD